MEIIPIDWNTVTPNVIIALVILSFLFMVWKSIKWMPEEKGKGASRRRYEETESLEKELKNRRK